MRYRFGVFAAIILAVSATLLSIASSRAGEPSAAAQPYPVRPIRIIIGFLPGSSSDVLARFLAHKLTEALGQQVIVDNRAGANGIIAAEIASKANADGHTLLLISTSHTMNAARPKLPYDPVKSFTPITTLGIGGLVLVAHPGFPAGSVKELIALARAKPQTVSYAIAGVGGINHFSAALFERIAQVQMLPIAYKGGAPALTDVIAGQVNLMFGTQTLALRQIQAGKVKALGVTTAKRSAHLPDVPPIAEAGAPGYEIGIWWGLIGPAGLPAGIVSRLGKEIDAILKLPETAKRLDADAAEPWLLPSGAFGKHLAAEVDNWRRVAREAKIQVD